MIRRVRDIFAIWVAFLACGAVAFIPAPSTRGFSAVNHFGSSKTSPSSHLFPQSQNPHACLKRQRRSLGSVQTMGVFGLGGLEIAIILVAAAFLLGPEQLANIGKDAGKFAGEFKDEWKDVPEEFQKGFEEGQIESKASKAKKMDISPAETTTEKDKE